MEKDFVLVRFFKSLTIADNTSTRKSPNIIWLFTRLFVSLQA